MKKPSQRGLQPKRRTYHDGANDERTAWLASLRRDEQIEKSPAVIAYIQKKVKWGLGRNERYNAKPGGLGRQ